MSTHNTDDPDNFEQIRPASISLGQPEAQQLPAVKSRLMPLLMIASGGLIIVLLAVFIYLPGWINTEKVLPVERPGNIAVSPAVSRPEPTKAPATKPASPWSEAQLSELRKQAQDTLAAALELDRDLKNRGVAVWAAEQYQQATAQAEQGDQHYRQADFEAAEKSYQQALALFTDLSAQAGDVLAQSIEAGQGFLHSGAATQAQQSFQQALLIEPGNPHALQGLKRAETLDQVRVLIAEADELIEQGELEKAIGLFGQARELDQHDQASQLKLSQAQERLRDRNFSQAMSRGYRALQERQHEKAVAEFNRALKIAPAAAEASSALAQARQGLITDKLSALLSRAHALEVEERWQEATVIFEQALALDRNSAEAEQGRHNAVQRQQLEEQLQRTISRPDRLSDKVVYQEALNLQAAASRIESAGSRLSKQKAELQELLSQASKPVQVSLISDTKTSVTIYRVGKLAGFENTKIELLPGRYVAVGTREGYRDVRVEFMVRADVRSPPVVIRCEEKIGPAF